MNTIGAFLPSRTNCQIHNKSDSKIKMIPKSYLDGVHPARGIVREDLVKDIPPGEPIYVKSDAYNLNEYNNGKQIKIHFVPTEIPAGNPVQKGKEIPPGSGKEIPPGSGTVHLKQHSDAAYPNGVEVAKVEGVLLHDQLRDKKIFLQYEKGGKVIIDSEPLKGESKKIVPQNEK